MSLMDDVRNSRMVKSADGFIEEAQREVDVEDGLQRIKYIGEKTARKIAQVIGKEVKTLGQAFTEIATDERLAEQIADLEGVGKAVISNLYRAILDLGYAIGYALDDVFDAHYDMWF